MRLRFETPATKGKPEKQPWVEIWDAPAEWVRRRIREISAEDQRAAAARARASGSPDEPPPFDAEAERRYARSVAFGIVAVGGDWSGLAPAFDPEVGGAPPSLPSLFGCDREGRERAIDARADFVDELPSRCLQAISAAFIQQLSVTRAEEGNSEAPSS